MSGDLTGLRRQGSWYTCPKGCFSTEPFRCEHITERAKALAALLDFLEEPTRPDPNKVLNEFLEEFS